MVPPPPRLDKVNFQLRFLPNADHPTTKEQFEMNYSTLLDVQDCLEIFTDSDTCQEIVATPTTILLNILCREVFVPQAINTIDGIITILPLLSKCTLLVSHNRSTPNRLSRSSLKKTIKDCIDKRRIKSLISGLTSPF